MLSTEVDSTGARAGFNEVKEAGRDMAQDVAANAGRASDAIEGIAKGGEAAAQKLDRQTQSIAAAIKRSTSEAQRALASMTSGSSAGTADYFEKLVTVRGGDAAALKPMIDNLRALRGEVDALATSHREAASQNAFINSLRSQTEAIGKSKADLLELQAAQMGVSIQAAPFIARLREAEGNLTNVGGASRQTAAALRMLPAQFSDIIVSLQSGQSPMTVFIQQGAQIKDMFGGAGAAVKAMAGYVAGLVNPFSIAAAAIAVGALAYKQGSAEADAYRQAIVSTGNAAGTTIGDLQGYAKAISSVVGTQGNASAALAEFVANGKVGSENLQEFAQSAIVWERATGVAIEKTADKFSDLAKEPLSAALKLNEGTNFLTESVYKQIKALTEQGKVSEAGAVAQKAYADALTSRAGEIERSLGRIERGWLSIKDAAKAGWDAMLNIGRAQSNTSKLAEIRKQIADRENQLAGIGGVPMTFAQSRQRAELEGLRAKEAALFGLVSAERAAANEQAQAAERTEARAQADKNAAKYLNDRAKMLKQIREESETIRTAYKGKDDPESQAAMRKELAASEKNIRAQYVDKSAAQELEKQARLFAELSGLTSDFAGEWESLNNAFKAGKLTVEQLTEAQAKLLAKQPAIKGAHDAQAKSLKDSEASYRKFLDTIGQTEQKYTTLAEQQEAANAAFGKGKTAIEEMALAQAKLALANEKDAGPWDPEQIAAMEKAVYWRERYVAALKSGDLKTVNAHTDELLRNAQEQAKLYQDEYQLMGLTALERAKIVALRQVELKYAKELAELDEKMAPGPDRDAQRAKIQQAKRIEGEAAVSKAIIDDWTRTTDQINQSLTDALLRGFESGKDFATNFRDTLKNMFATLVLRPIISFIVSPISGLVNGVVQSGLNAMGIGGGGSNLLGLAGNASSLYSFGGSAMNWLGIGAGAYGTASAAATAAAAGSYAAPGMMAMVNVPGSAVAGAAASGGLSGALGAIPGWGWAAMAGLAVLGSLVKDDSGTLHTGGQAQYSKDKGLANSVERGEFGINIGMVRGADTEKAVSEIAKGIVGTLDSLSVAFGGKGGFEVATGYADDTSKDGAWGGLRISRDGKDLLNWDTTQSGKWAAREFANGEEGWKQYLQAVATDTMKVLKDMDLPGWADDLIKSLGDAPSMEALAGVVQQINAGAAAFEALGKHVVGFAAMSDEARTALTRELGGTDKVASEYESFRQNYYSEGERKKAKESDVASALAEVGLQMPKTRAEFRALVEAQQALGESGSKALAVLLSVDEAFADITPSAENTASSMEAIGEEIKQSLGFTSDGLSSLLKDSVKGANSQEEASRNASAAFEQQIYDGMFNAMTSSISDMLMQAVIGPMVESLVMGGNVASMSMATGGIAAATGMATGGAVAGSGLATGGAMGGAASASGGAAAASAMAAGGASAGAAMAAGGAAAGSRVDDAVERARQYMATFTQMMKDPGIRDAFTEVGNIVGDVAGELWKTKGTFYQDAAFVGGAAGGMSGAMQDAGKSMQNLTDAIVEEVKRIRGIVAGEKSPASYAMAQAEFATATAQARAGDKDAAAKLPELSRAMLELAQANVRSSADLKYFQASTAASLQQTAEAIAKKYGVKLPAFADGGTHAGGWALVGEKGPELAYMPPSRIYTAAQTASIRGAMDAGDSAGAVGDAMREFRTAVQSMDKRMAEQQRLLKQTDDNIERFRREGLAIRNQPGTTLATKEAV